MVGEVFFEEMIINLNDENRFLSLVWIRQCFVLKFYKLGYFFFYKEIVIKLVFWQFWEEGGDCQVREFFRRCFS